ncbi:MAG: prolipoprotein diacylglyceryl transferase [Candidatus Woesearchaeota archaeon]
MFEHAINPVLIELGPLQVRWYGVMWALSFLFVYFYVRRSVRTGMINLTQDDVDWLMVWLVAGVIIGARLLEVLVWEPAYYFANPGEIIAIWHGGLSFHGGLLGGLIAGYLFARRRKIRFLNLCDVCVVPIALGQALGRIGNFINGELFGRITNVPWAVKFPGAEGYRHPSQLYEAAYDVIIFFVLLCLRNKKMANGSLLALFLVLYSVFRFIAEYFREPTAFVGPLTLGQALNIPMFIAGIVLFFWIARKV